MNDLILAIMSLDKDGFHQNISKGVQEENRKLISKIILTAIRRFCINLIKKEKFATISEIALLFMENLQQFRSEVVQYDSSIDSDIRSLLLSILFIHFPKGLEEYQTTDFDNLKTLDAQTYQSFQFSGLLNHLRDVIVNQIRKECISIVEAYKEDFEHSALDDSLDKLASLLYIFQDRFPDITKEKHNLKMDIHKYTVKIRSSAIFDIVTSFPESKPALIDLKKSCLRTSSHSEVAKTAKKIFITRLLHLGAGTSDIVTQYINAIQAFNIIDESGGLTRSVSPPIQEYLTTRSDLLDTIVNRILEDDSLVVNTKSAQKPNDDDLIREPDVQKELDFSWAPEPMHSHIRDLQSLVRDASDSDALALLLNVYGSIPLFVTQLEKEISKRIETSPEFDFANEVRAIELLKKRFGNQSFLNCEVILRDVADSKRLATTFDCQEVQPLVISHLYWPEVQNEFVKLPEDIDQQLTEYKTKFEQLKEGRKLNWQPSAGAVELELEFENHDTLQITVPPICACVALLMNDESEITVEMVCDTLEVTRQSAESALSYWVSNDIFVKSGNLYRMAQTKPVTSAAVFDAEQENDDDEQQEEEEELEPHVKDANMFGIHVQSILTNRQKVRMTLQSLYSLLQKFVQSPCKFDRTFDQYIKMLGYLVEKEMIQINGEVVAILNPPPPKD